MKIRPQAYGLYKITGPPIGSGQYGYVFPSKNPSYDFNVAIKIVETLHDNKFRYGIVKSAMREIALTKYVTKVTKSVIPKYCKVSLWNKKYIGIPFMKMQCSLSQYLKKKKSGINESDMIVIMFKTLHCIQTLHRVGIVHNDISAHNIVINHDRRKNILDLRLCDLGLGYVQDSENVNTPNRDVYKAGEMFENILPINSNDEIKHFISLFKHESVETLLADKIFENIKYNTIIPQLKSNKYEKSMLLNNLKLIDEIYTVSDFNDVLKILYTN